MFMLLSGKQKEVWNKQRKGVGNSSKLNKQEFFNRQDFKKTIRNRTFKKKNSMKSKALKYVVKQILTSL